MGLAFALLEPFRYLRGDVGFGSGLTVSSCNNTSITDAVTFRGGSAMWRLDVAARCGGSAG
jgi:hypothetical protein